MCIIKINEQQLQQIRDKLHNGVWICSRHQWSTIIVQRTQSTSDKGHPKRMSARQGKVAAFIPRRCLSLTSGRYHSMRMSTKTSEARGLPWRRLAVLVTCFLGGWGHSMRMPAKPSDARVRPMESTGNTCYMRMSASTICLKSSHGHVWQHFIKVILRA